MNVDDVYYYYYYYYLLQLSFHSVVIVLTLVTNSKHTRTLKETIQKHSKYKYTCYQNTLTIVKTPTHYKTHTYTHPHITKPTHTHTHILQNPHMHTPKYYKTS